MVQDSRKLESSVTLPLALTNVSHYWNWYQRGHILWRNKKLKFHIGNCFMQYVWPELLTPSLRGKIHITTLNTLLYFEWFMTMLWWYIIRTTTNQCIYRYVNLLYYKQRSLLHVSATCCDHLQEGVIWRMYYTEHQHNLIYKNNC